MWYNYKKLDKEYMAKKGKRIKKEKTKTSYLNLFDTKKEWTYKEDMGKAVQKTTKDVYEKLKDWAAGYDNIDEMPKPYKETVLKTVDISKEELDRAVEELKTLMADGLKKKIASDSPNTLKKYVTYPDIHKEAYPFCSDDEPVYKYTSTPRSHRSILDDLPNPDDVMRSSPDTGGLYGYYETQKKLQREIDRVYNKSHHYGYAEDINGNPVCIPAKDSGGNIQINPGIGGVSGESIYDGEIRVEPRKSGNVYTVGDYQYVGPSASPMDQFGYSSGEVSIKRDSLYSLGPTDTYGSGGYEANPYVYTTKDPTVIYTGDKVSTPEGNGVVYEIDNNGTYVVQLNKEIDKNILYEFNLNELKKIEDAKYDDYDKILTD